MSESSSETLRSAPGAKRGKGVSKGGKLMGGNRVRLSACGTHRKAAATRRARSSRAPHRRACPPRNIHDTQKGICYKARPQAPQTLGTNLSLITTAKRQGRDPLAFLHTLLLHGPSAAQPFLYRNPPDTS